MFSSTNNTGIKLHLLLIIIIAGVGYFMYQLYSECKDLERELIIAKRQIALLSSHKNGIQGDCLATLMCPLGGPPTACTSNTCKVAAKDAKAKPAEDTLESDEEIEIDIDEDDASVKSEYINKVMANVQKAHDQDVGLMEEDDDEAKTDAKTNAKTKAATQKDSDSDSGSDEAEPSEQESESEAEADAESEVESEDDSDLSQLSKAELNKLKLSDLKEYLKSRKQTTTGSKAELVARIQLLTA